MKNILCAAALFLLLLLNSYLLFSNSLLVTAIFGIILVIGTVLALFSVKLIGRYYSRKRIERPEKILYLWDERFGLQVFRWFENMKKGELVLLALLALAAVTTLRLVGTFSVLFFVYAYFSLAAVESAFRLKNTTFITKEGLYRYARRGLKRLVAWDEIAEIKKHDNWFVYIRKKGFGYYYLSPEKHRIDFVYKLILKHKK